MSINITAAMPSTFGEFKDVCKNRIKSLNDGIKNTTKQLATFEKVVKNIPDSFGDWDLELKYDSNDDVGNFIVATLVFDEEAYEENEAAIEKYMKANGGDYWDSWEDGSFITQVILGLDD